MVSNYYLINVRNIRHSCNWAVIVEEKRTEEEWRRYQLFYFRYYIKKILTNSAVKTIIKRKRPWYECEENIGILEYFDKFLKKKLYKNSTYIYKIREIK